VCSRGGPDDFENKKSLVPTGIRTPDRPARRQSLYRLIFQQNVKIVSQIKIKSGLFFETASINFGVRGVVYGFSATSPETGVSETSCEVKKSVTPMFMVGKTMKALTVGDRVLCFISMHCFCFLFWKKCLLNPAIKFWVLLYALSAVMSGF
jgi:hypothetical protein